MNADRNGTRRNRNAASGAAAGAPANTGNAARRNRTATRRNNAGINLLKIPAEYMYSEGVYIVSAKEIYTKTTKGNNYKEPAKVKKDANKNYITNMLTNQNRNMLEESLDTSFLYDEPLLKWITGAPRIKVLKAYCGTPGLELYYTETIKNILKRNYFFEIAVNKEGYIEGFAILNHSVYNQAGVPVRSISISELCSGVKRGGVGRRLVEKCIEFARAFGCKKVELSSVPTAIEFYEKMGFVDIYKRENTESCKITRDEIIRNELRNEISSANSSQKLPICKKYYEKLYGEINNENTNENEPITDKDILSTCNSILKTGYKEPSNCLMVYRIE
jgi:N-acetylglutamate synthase-like GNAT family acetyltransferase